MRAGDAEDRDLLYKERVFDDVLVREGVTTHYLPLSREGEKGIDVWLALEAYELAIYKRYNVVVLVASDGDFLPLVRKLNTLGTRVMILGWDFKYVDQNGNDRENAHGTDAPGRSDVPDHDARPDRRSARQRTR